jgi:hypothetical protein
MSIIEKAQITRGRNVYHTYKKIKSWFEENPEKSVYEGWEITRRLELEKRKQKTLFTVNQLHKKGSQLNWEDLKIWNDELARINREIKSLGRSM